MFQRKIIVDYLDRIMKCSILHVRKSKCMLERRKYVLVKFSPLQTVCVKKKKKNGPLSQVLEIEDVKSHLAVEVWRFHAGARRKIVRLTHFTLRQAAPSWDINGPRTNDPLSMAHC